MFYFRRVNKYENMSIYRLKTMINIDFKKEEIYYELLVLGQNPK